MQLQEKVRVAEIERSKLEVEIQFVRDQMALRKAEADKCVNTTCPKGKVITIVWDKDD